MRRFKNLLILAGIFLLPLASFAQVRRMIGNGGNFSDPNVNMSIGTYDPSNGTYTYFDSTDANSVSNILIVDDTAYVAAEKYLLKYDLTTYQLLDSTTVEGIRAMALYGDHLVVSRAFPVLANYVQVLHRSDLSVAYSLPQVSDECESIVVVGDTAYVAVKGSFLATEGKLAVIDLVNENFVREENFDSLGAQPTSMYTDGNTLFLVNSINFSSTFGTITRYDLQNGSHTITQLPVTAGGGAGFKNGLIYASFGSGIGTYDTAGDSLRDLNLVPGSFASSNLADLPDLLYANTTDYSTYGRCFRYDLNGVLVDSFEVGISPEAIAVDYGTVSSREVDASADEVLQLFPNPVQDQLTLRLKTGTSAVQVQIRDLAGRIVYDQTQSLLFGEAKISLNWLSPGTYLLQANQGDGVQTIKFIKR